MSTEVGEVKYKITGDNSELSSTISQSESIAKKAAAGIGKAFAAVAVSMAAVGSAMASAAAMGVKYNAQMETYTTALTTALGSEAKALQAIEQIRRDAAATPFDVAGLVQANQLLISTGESAEASREVILALGDAVSASGGGNDELARMAQNLQQIKNVGVATAVDIKQFAMAGINVYKVLADYTGKTTEEVQEMEISYELLTAALKSAASEGGMYFDAMNKQAQTFNGQISTLKDNASALLGDMTQGLFDIAKNKALPTINSYLERIQKAFSKNGFKGVTKEFGSVLADLATQVTKSLPKLVSGAGEIVKSLVTGIKDNAPALADSAVELGMTLVEGFLSIAPDLAAGAVTLVGNLAVNIVKSIPQLIASVGESFFKVGAYAVNAIVEGVTGTPLEGIALERKVESWASSVTSAVDDIAAATPTLTDFSLVLSETGKSLSELDSIIAENEAAATQVLAEYLAEQKRLRGEDLADVQSYIANLSSAYAEKAGAISGLVGSETLKVELAGDTEGGLTEEYAFERIKAGEEYSAEAMRILEEGYAAELALIEQTHRQAGTLNDAAYKEDLKAAQAHYDAQVAIVKGNQAGLLEAVSEGATNWVSADSEKYAALSGLLDEFNGMTASKAAENVAAVRATFVELIDGISLDAANSFLVVQAQLSSVGGVMSEEAVIATQNILAAFEGLPPGCEEQAKASLLAMVSGMEAYIPELANAGEMSVSEILAAMQGYFSANQSAFAAAGKSATEAVGSGVAEGGAAAASAAESAGGATGDGLIAGLRSRIQAVAAAARELAAAAVVKVKNFLGINSPSRVFKDIGRYSAEGYAEGMEDNIAIPESAAEKMAHSVTTPFANPVESIVSVIPTMPQTAPIQIEVPLTLDGREIARATAWYTSEQLSWEEM